MSRDVATETRQRYVAAGIGVKHDTEVARALGVSREAVRLMRVALGLACVWKREVAAREDACRAAAAAEKPCLASVDDIAAVAGVRRDYARELAARIGIRLRPGDCASGTRKHTVTEIVAALNECGSVAAAADMLGYSRTYMGGLMGGSRCGTEPHQRRISPLRTLVPDVDGRRR